MSTQPNQTKSLKALKIANPSEAANAGQRYRFKHLSLPDVMRDMYFSRNAPAPGDQAPAPA